MLEPCSPSSPRAHAGKHARRKRVLQCSTILRQYAQQVNSATLSYIYDPAAGSAMSAHRLLVEWSEYIVVTERLIALAEGCRN